jgi:ribosome biogenesis protein MAK21
MSNVCFVYSQLFSTVPGLRTILNADNTFDTIGLEEGKYDPLKRDPKHANASSSPLWELVCYFFICDLTSFFIEF